ncbi:MAG: PorT family protein [Chitinophagaceae bacterium]|nr:PorT family protein [Chitinophagaceae bacterium]MCW5928610.1 PorT family protein [Chitinophagaceae bacterium]
MNKLSVFFTLALLLASFCSYSQTSKTGKIKYGIKAGINLANYGHSSEYKKDFREDGGRFIPIFSFHAGGFADYSITESFSIQAGLTLSGKGGKESWSGEDDDDFYDYDAYYKENLLWLELPVNAIYKTGRFYAGGGPYIGCALSGKWKEGSKEDYGGGDIEEDSETGKIVFGGEDGWRRRIDYGFNFLAGYQVTEKINIGANFGLGLMNLYNESNRDWRDYWSMKNRVLSISVGYTF